MRRVGVGFLVLAAIALGVPNLNAQESLIPERTPPLVLTGAIPLPSVHGRIDHMGFDPKGRLFISALGNNTEEVVDPSAGIRSHTITGIPKPQGVIYCAELNKLFVGSDEGKLYVYNAKSFDLITSVDFGDELDNLRYDAAANSFMSVMGTKTMERSAWSMQPQTSGWPGNSNSSLTLSFRWRHPGPTVT